MFNEKMQSATNMCRHKCRKTDFWWPHRPEMFGMRDYRYAKCLERCQEIQEKLIHSRKNIPYKLPESSLHDDTPDS